MKVTRENHAVIDYLTGQNSLLDSKLVLLRVAESSGGMEISMCFHARSGASSSELALKFSDVVECGFYFTSEFVFYNVEQVKLEATAKGYFYLSLDPDMETVGESQADQDFVKARRVCLVTSD